MSKAFNLTEEHLYFISFMARECASRPEYKDRFTSCMDNLLVAQDSKSSNTKSEQVQHHSPHKMIEFLSLFSKDDDFKWFTHKWDQDELTLETLMNQQADKRNKLSGWLYKTDEPINEKTYNQVWNFINFNNEKEYPWRSNDDKPYKVGWHSIVEQHNQSPELPIENLKLEDGILFLNYIRLFKGSIEFRTDLRTDDRFNVVIRNLIKQSINGAVELKFTENFKIKGRDVNIYCDIPSLLFGLRIICDWIVKHKINGSLATVDFFANPDSYEIIIFHHDSYFLNITKLTEPSGDFCKLRERLFSVCDFKMHGDLHELGNSRGSIVIDGLSSNTTKTNEKLSPCNIEHLEEIVGGIKYILKLYKS